MALTAVIRLDPCIAFYCGGDVKLLSSRITINGDVYVHGELNNSNRANINGDAYVDRYSGNVRDIVGSINDTEVSGITITSPALDPALYAQSYIPDANGQITLTNETLVFNDTFVVNGNLIVNGGFLTINAPKNSPAMLLGGSLTLSNGATINITGYTQITGGIATAWDTNLTICGALHLAVPASITVEIDIDGSGQVVVTADPMAAALRIPGSPVQDWSPAAGAFYKSITRQ
ncbi:MAG TPA: hypothetical protein ENN81_09870 [Phycisphaerales bacterium]|nr:hypothetical protein [Phycisphaerales bacterium]